MLSSGCALFQTAEESCRSVGPGWYKEPSPEFDACVERVKNQKELPYMGNSPPSVNVYIQ
jgi:hypothetical protein